MLTPFEAKSIRSGKARVAIVASQYNARYVDGMLKAARAQLKRVGIRQVEIVRVPGAFEIPAVAAALASSSVSSTSKNPAFDVIICFGVIFQGQTSHAQHIGWGVTHALAQIQVQNKIPVIHAVFVFDKEEHAKVRCLGKSHNRGAEAVQTALTMALVMKKLRRAR